MKEHSKKVFGCSRDSFRRGGVLWDLSFTRTH